MQKWDFDQLSSRANSVREGEQLGNISEKDDSLDVT